MVMLVAESLVREISQCGVSLEVRGDRIRFSPRSRMTPELIERLCLHKPEVLVILKASSGATITKTQKNTGKSGVIVSVTAQNQPKSGEVHVLRPGHPLADFDADSVFGTTPHHIQHKDPICRSQEFWQHRWGGFYCSQCWPCADAIMQIKTDQKPEPKPRSGDQTKPTTDWTAEEKQLVTWLTDNYDRLIDETETFQHQIDIAGLILVIRRGPAAHGMKQVISDLRILQRNPAEFHAEMARRHERELDQ
jgi:hypothetical protein